MRPSPAMCSSREDPSPPRSRGYPVWPVQPTVTPMERKSWGLQRRVAGVVVLHLLGGCVQAGVSRGRRLPWSWPLSLIRPREMRRIPSRRYWFPWTSALALATLAHRGLCPLPFLRVSLYEPVEQLLRFLQVQLHDLDPVLEYQPQLVLLKVLRLPDGDLCDAKLDDGAGAHVARHERGVHGHPAEAARSLSGVVEAVDLGVHHDGLVLHPAVTAGGHRRPRESTRAAPMGIPPSSAPVRASDSALSINPSNLSILSGLGLHVRRCFSVSLVFVVGRWAL